MNYEVCNIIPLWRYAVVPTNGCAPGIPYYTLRGAERMFWRAVKEIPFAGVILIKREWFKKGFIIVKEYIPTQKNIDEYYEFLKIKYSEN